MRVGRRRVLEDFNALMEFLETRLTERLGRMFRDNTRRILQNPGLYDQLIYNSISDVYATAGTVAPLDPNYTILNPETVQRIINDNWPRTVDLDEDGTVIREYEPFLYWPPMARGLTPFQTETYNLASRILSPAFFNLARARQAAMLQDLVSRFPRPAAAFLFIRMRRRAYPDNGVESHPMLYNMPNGVVILPGNYRPEEVQAPEELARIFPTISGEEEATADTDPNLSSLPGPESSEVSFPASQNMQPTSLPTPGVPSTSVGLTQPQNNQVPATQGIILPSLQPGSSVQPALFNQTANSFPTLQTVPGPLQLPQVQAQGTSLVGQPGIVLPPIPTPQMIQNPQQATRPGAQFATQPLQSQPSQFQQSIVIHQKRMLVDLFEKDIAGRLGNIIGQPNGTFELVEYWPRIVPLIQGVARSIDPGLTILTPSVINTALRQIPLVVERNLIYFPPDFDGLSPLQTRVYQALRTVRTREFALMTIEAQRRVFEEILAGFPDHMSAVRFLEAYFPGNLQVTANQISIPLTQNERIVSYLTLDAFSENGAIPRWNGPWVEAMVSEANALQPPPTDVASTIQRQFRARVIMVFPVTYTDDELRERWQSSTVRALNRIVMELDPDRRILNIGTVNAILQEIPSVRRLGLLYWETGRANQPITTPEWEFLNPARPMIGLPIPPADPELKLPVSNQQPTPQQTQSMKLRTNRRLDFEDRASSGPPNPPTALQEGKIRTGTPEYEVWRAQLIQGISSPEFLAASDQDKAAVLNFMLDQMAYFGRDEMRNLIHKYWPHDKARVPSLPDPALGILMANSPPIVYHPWLGGPPELLPTTLRNYYLRNEQNQRNAPLDARTNSAQHEQRMVQEYLQILYVSEERDHPEDDRVRVPVSDLLDDIELMRGHVWRANPNTTLGEYIDVLEGWRERALLILDIKKRLGRRCRNQVDLLTFDDVNDIPENDFIRMRTGYCWHIDSLLDYIQETTNGRNDASQITNYGSQQLWENQGELARIMDHERATARNFRQWMTARQDAAISDHISVQTLDAMYNTSQVLVSRGPFWARLVQETLDPTYYALFMQYTQGNFYKLSRVPEFLIDGRAATDVEADKLQADTIARIVSAQRQLNGQPLTEEQRKQATRDMAYDPEATWKRELPPNIIPLRSNLRNQIKVVMKRDAVNRFMEYYQSLSRDEKDALRRVRQSFEEDLTTCHKGRLCVYNWANVLLPVVYRVSRMKGIQANYPEINTSES